MSDSKARLLREVQELHARRDEAVRIAEKLYRAYRLAVGCDIDEDPKDGVNPDLEAAEAQLEGLPEWFWRRVE